MNNNANTNPPATSSTTSSTPMSQRATPQAIDIEQIADKVYRLMQADVRLTRARSGTSRVRK